jgi:hypothetical protein
MPIRPLPRDAHGKIIRPSSAREPSSSDRPAPVATPATAPQPFTAAQNPHYPGFDLDSVSESERKANIDRFRVNTFSIGRPQGTPDPAPGEVTRANVELPKELERFRWIKQLSGLARDTDDVRYYAWHWASVQRVERAVQEQHAAARAALATKTSDAQGTAPAPAQATEQAPAADRSAASAGPLRSLQAQPAAVPIFRTDAVNDADLRSAAQSDRAPTTSAPAEKAEPPSQEEPSVFKFNPRAKPAPRRRENEPPVNSAWALEPVLHGFYSVADKGAMVHAESLKTITFRDFETQYSGVLPRGTVRALLAEAEFETHKCTSIRYDPGKPTTFEEDGTRFFNSYRPVDYEAKPGPTGPLTELLTTLLGGDLDAVAQVVSILAHLVQRPGQRLGYALCFVSRASLNKELLQHLLVALLGDKNTFVPDSQLFTSQFNDWVRYTSLVILNHVSTTKAFQEKMAYLVTSTELSVSIKGVDPTQVPNRLNVIAFARELGDLEHFSDPRRLGVFDLSERPVTSQTYTDFKAWLDGDGKSHALHALSTHDLSGFDHLRPPVNVRAQEQLDVLSRSPIQDYLQEALTARRAPMVKDLVNINEVTTALLGVGFRAVTTADVRKALQELGAVHAGQVRGIEGQAGKPNFWAVRRQQYWATQPEGVKRAYLEHPGHEDDNDDAS